MIITKTKELIIDFRTEPAPHDKLIIMGEEVETVVSYKYLGVNVDDKLNWNVHASSVLSKTNQRMYFVRKLKYFKISGKYVIQIY